MEAAAPVAYLQLDALAAGASGSWSWQAKVGSGVAAGTTIPTKVGVVSQNTVAQQDEGDTLSLTVTAP